VAPHALHAVCRRTAALVAGTALVTVPTACTSKPASTVAKSTPPPVTGSFNVRTFAAGPNESQPYAITMLGNKVYVAFQNGVGAKGQTSSSGAKGGSVQEYTMAGALAASWTLPGHIDGLTADADNHRLIATVNEANDSRLYTITPGANPPTTQYTYSQQPFPHGGGIGAVTFYHGHLLVSAAAPTAKDGPAVYQVTLHGSTADVSPVFADNADALVANDGQQEDQHATLALTDPGPNGVVPAKSPRFGGDFVLADGRGREQIYFDESAQPSERLHVLDLSEPIADTVWVQQRNDTLWASDADHNDVAAISGSFHPGQAITAVISQDKPHYLGELNLSTGQIQQLEGLSGVVPAGGLLMVSHGG
jgi:hypothetical protein